MIVIVMIKGTGKVCSIWNSTGSIFVIFFDTSGIRHSHSSHGFKMNCVKEAPQQAVAYYRNRFQIRSFCSLFPSHPSYCIPSQLHSLHSLCVPVCVWVCEWVSVCVCVCARGARAHVRMCVRVRARACMCVRGIQCHVIYFMRLMY